MQTYLRAQAESVWPATSHDESVWHTCWQTHPHTFQRLHFFVEAEVDVLQVEQGVSCDLSQQVPGEVAHWMFREVPLAEHPAGHHGLFILMAALAEVATDVFAIPQSLNVPFLSKSKRKIPYSGLH